MIDTTKHLDGVVAVDPEARTATVQPGVVLDDLNAAAAPHGLRFGPDPASSNRATLGGMLGTNATGTHSIQYGSTVDFVESARVVLADGTVADFDALSDDAWAGKTRLSGIEGDLYGRVGALLSLHELAIRNDTPRWWRRAGGYRLERLMEAPDVDRGPGRAWDGTRNLAHLLAGSEGTLGMATELDGRARGAPAARRPGRGPLHDAARRARSRRGHPGDRARRPSSCSTGSRSSARSAWPSTHPKLHFVQRTSPTARSPSALLIVEYERRERRRRCADGLERLRRQLGPRAVITNVEDERAASPTCGPSARWGSGWR